MSDRNLKKDNLAVLILAGKVNLPNYNFKSHEYLFNIGNSLAFEKIIKKLDLNTNTSIYISVANLNNKFKNLLPFDKAKFIEVGNTDTVIDSISKALEKINERVISIVPITTIPELSNDLRQCCYFGSKQIPKENWSSISRINDGNFKFHFKNDFNSYGLSSYPCTGRLVADKIHLKNSIKQIDSYKKADILSLVEI